MVITYPFCGLDNLSRRLTSEELGKISRYAEIVFNEPMKFFEDVLGKFNRELWSIRYQEMGGSEEYSSPDIFLTRKENRILNRVLKSKRPRKILWKFLTKL